MSLPRRHAAANVLTQEVVVAVAAVAAVVVVVVVVVAVAVTAHSLIFLQVGIIL
jgi:hypothetical protein